MDSLHESWWPPLQGSFGICNTPIVVKHPSGIVVKAQIEWGNHYKNNSSGDKHLLENIQRIRTSNYPPIYTFVEEHNAYLFKKNNVHSARSVPGFSYVLVDADWIYHVSEAMHLPRNKSRVIYFNR